MKVKFFVLDADYVVEEGKPVIRLWGRTEDGKTIAVLDRNFLPYFFVEAKSERDMHMLSEKIRRLEIEGMKPVKAGPAEKTVFGRPMNVLKVSAVRPSDIQAFRDAVKNWAEVREEYEYTISFYKRYLIDKGLVPLGLAEVEGREIKTGLNADLTIEAERVKPAGEGLAPSFKTIAFDIESAREGGEEKIVMVSVFGKNISKAFTWGIAKKGRDVEFAATEEEMIKSFVDFVRKENPDILATFNGDLYDFKKLEERAGAEHLLLGRDGRPMQFGRRVRVSAARIKGIVHVDIFNFVNHILSPNMATDVLTLNSVANEIIGAGKEEMEWADIEDMWRKREIKKLAVYCLRDAELTYKLAERLLPEMYEICRTAGQALFDVSRMTYSQLVEWLLMRRAFEAGEIIANPPKFEEIEIRRRIAPYIGGYVHTPKEGLHKNIALFDFASLYPSIIVTHNISPDTIECGCCSPQKARNPNVPPGSGKHFCAKKKGFVTKIAEELIKKRRDVQAKMDKLNPKSQEYKTLENRQYALKIMANAMYGYYGYAGSRWYSRMCAESITAFGRYYIKKVIEIAEKAKYEVIYGDTDSLFLKVKNKKEAGQFLEKVNKSLPGIIEMNFHGLYPLGIFVLAKTAMAAKKRYALIDGNGEITIKGFETVRRDWAGLAKGMQEKIFSAILREKSIEKAVRLVRRIISELNAGKTGMEELVVYTQITRPLSQYEQIGPHVAAAKKAVERGRTISEGNIVGYIITKGPGSISQKAELKEFARDYDPDYYINHQIVPAAMRILGGLGVKEEDFFRREGREQASLEKFIRGRK